MRHPEMVTKVPRSDDRWHSRLASAVGTILERRRERWEAEMWDWAGHMGGWWWVMVPLMIALWALVIWGLATLIRAGTNR